MELLWTVEQVFVTTKGGAVDVMMVLENPAGARFRERFSMPGNDRREAVRRAARWLAYRNQVGGTRRLRLRVERGGTLEDDARLKDAFDAALREELGVD